MSTIQNNQKWTSVEEHVSTEHNATYCLYCHANGKRTSVTSINQKIYTFEHFRPAFPLTGDHVVIHRGTFEDNRESFSPSLVRARDFYATDDADALSKGQRAAATIPATFGGFNDAE